MFIASISSICDAALGDEGSSEVLRDVEEAKNVGRGSLVLWSWFFGWDGWGYEQGI